MLSYQLPVTTILQEIYLFLVAKQVINTAIWLDDDVCVYF